MTTRAKEVIDLDHFSNDSLCNRELTQQAQVAKPRTFNLIPYTKCRLEALQNPGLETKNIRER